MLIEGGFDAFAEASCRPYYAARMGAPSVPPGRYFRMHLVGYFEGIDSERGLEWRCSDSLSLRAFLRLGSRDRVPDHSWLSRSRTRLPHEVHAAVFDWVLVLIAEAGLIKGERIGVDASTMEANAALRNIVRRDNGEGYREMLERLARESGVETPTAEDLARLEHKRKGKKLSNTDWVSKSDPEAKIAKMKDGTTHLAYKPEHAVDLDTGAVVAAELHPADEGDTTTLSKTLAKAEANLEAVDAAPTSEDPAECVADKGYHSRAVLRALNDSPWKTRIAAPKQTGFSRWHGDDAARRAVTNNRARLKSGVAREAFKLRAEIVERCFAHNLDRGGMRRTWLRGRENVHKRYLLHVAGHNLSLLMRQRYEIDAKSTPASGRSPILARRRRQGAASQLPRHDRRRGDDPVDAPHIGLERVPRQDDEVGEKARPYRAELLFPSELRGAVGGIAGQRLLQGDRGMGAGASSPISRRVMLVSMPMKGLTRRALWMTSLDSVTLARRAKKRPTSWERPARPGPRFTSQASPNTVLPNQWGVKLACTSSAPKRSMSVSATENRWLAVTSIRKGRPSAARACSTASRMFRAARSPAACRCRSMPWPSSSRIRSLSRRVGNSTPPRLPGSVA